MTTLNVALMPDGRIVRSEFSGRLCADALYYFGFIPKVSNLCLPSDPLEQHHFVAVHRSGTLMIGLDWEYREDYSPEFMRLGVRCGSSGVDQLWAKGGTSGPPVLSDDDLTHANPRRPPLQVSVPAPSMCEIKPWAYRSFKTVIPATQYRLTIDHPR